MYDYVDFKSDNTGNTKVKDFPENHTFVNDTCVLCGVEKSIFIITLNINTSPTNKEFVIYVLDSSNNPTRQFVVGSDTGQIVFEINKNDTFTIQIYETLYMQSTIDTESTLKKNYLDVTSDKEINITITGVMNVNNWIVI